jgi:hypothetical protein
VPAIRKHGSTISVEFTVPNKGRNGKVCRYGRSHARRHQTIPGDACTKAEAR